MLSDSVRQFRKEDWPAFAVFIKKQFHEKYILSDEKFFEWQYRRNPYVDDYAFFLLEQDGKLYGCIGIVPLDYKVGDRTARLNTYVNLFADERVRGFGLGTLLIKKAMEQGRTAMVDGYNPNSFSIYQKLGAWKDMGKFYRYVLFFNREAVTGLCGDKLPINVGNIPLIINLSSITSEDIQFEHRGTFDSSFDAFWNSIKDKYAITAERASSYLNWRYAEHPYLDYIILVAKKDDQITGFIVYRIEAVDGFSIARIIDFVSNDESEVALLRKFSGEVKEKGAAVADFMFSGWYYHQALKTLGFSDVYGTAFENLPIYFNPVSYARNYINFAAWSDDKSINKELFYNKDNWYLTKGDSDQDRPNPH